MRRFGIAGALISIFVAIPLLLAIAPARPPPANHLPVVTSSLPPAATFSPLAPIRFTLTVTDADGDAVYARITDAPRETRFLPIVNAPSGATHEVVISPNVQNDRSELGPQRVVVESWDARQPWRKSRTAFRFRVVGVWGSQGMRLLQLDQDPEPEIEARAQRAEIAGFRGYGALAIFDLSSSGTRYDADPELWTASPIDDPSIYEMPEQIGDVNGDGLDDFIAVHEETEVYVWFGGTAAGSRPPDVTLRSKDQSFHYQTATHLVADVTGDGIDDIVLGSPWVDTTATGAGEVLVFAGGPHLGQTTAPTATLRVPGASASDSLGYDFQNRWFDPFRVGDVTGDGIADLLVVDAWVRVNGIPAVGAIYVWSGGAALQGVPAPVATLATTTTPRSGWLGFVDNTVGVFLIDVTGDGQLDVVAASPKGAGPDGAIFVWQGGSGIAGTVAPTAILEPSPGAYGGPGSELPNANGTDIQSLQFSDLNLDGITDVIAARSKATIGGSTVAGAIYFFAGGALSGKVNETALLRRTKTHNDDAIASASDGLQLVDVTGDGAPDVVIGSSHTSATATSSGAIEVFAARSGLSGAVTPSASLEVPGAMPNDGLTRADQYSLSTGLLVDDVTGDGIRDIIGVAAFADLGTLPDVGAIYVWPGGAGLTSGATVAPTATLVDPNPRAGMKLGERQDPGPSIHLVDWDGDGVQDLVAFDSEVTKVSTTGRALVWRGGATLAGTPLPFATADASQVSDGFGDLGVYYYSHLFREYGFWFADVTGDDIVDMLVTAPFHDTSRGRDAGAVYVFAGGPTAAGNLTPTAMLEDRFGWEDDNFGGMTKFLFADLNSDGFDDVIASDPHARFPARILVFPGPIGSATTSRDLFAPKLGNGRPDLGD